MAGDDKYPHPVMRDPVREAWEKAKPGRPWHDATDSFESACASVKAFADKATEMLNQIEAAGWWKIITMGVLPPCKVDKP